MRVIIVVAAAVVATSAHAQTTNCHVFGNTMSCNTTPDPWARQQASQQQFQNNMAALGASLRARRERKAMEARAKQDVESIRQYVAAGECETAAAIAQPYSDAAQIQAMIRANCTPKPTAEQLLTSQVAQAVREGRCGDAKNLALAGNRLDIADQAVRLCTPAVAAAPAP